MRLFQYILSSFTQCIDFKSRISRFEFFTGLITSGLFLLLNIIIFLQLIALNQSETWDIISIMFILIAVLFAFIQSHSLVARRLNDISVNPYFAFIPFLLASVYLLIKTFTNVYAYGHFIFIGILFVIVIYSILMVSESD